MALEKISEVDQITILKDGQIMVRTTTRIMEDGKQILSTYHRQTLTPDNDAKAIEDPFVKAHAEITWTPEIKTAFTASKLAAQAEMENEIKGIKQ